MSERNFTRQARSDKPAKPDRDFWAILCATQRRTKEELGKTPKSHVSQV